MQIKVSSTKNHEVMEHGKGNLTHDTIKTVAEGKLVLIETKWQENKDMLFRKSNGQLFFCAKFLGIPSEGDPKGVCLQPIIISEAEKIEVDDWYHHLGYNKQIFKADKDSIEELQKVEVVKLLALPEHFSSEQLQMIIDGKLKDGDKVLVECEKWFNQDAEIGSDWGHKSIEMKVKLDSQSHITLYPIEEKMYTREEMRALVFRAYNLRTEDKEVRSTRSLEKWFDKNVK